MENLYVVMEQDIGTFRIHEPAFHTEKSATDYINKQPKTLQYLLSIYKVETDVNRPRPLGQRFADHMDRRIKEIHKRQRDSPLHRSFKNKKAK